MDSTLSPIRNCATGSATVSPSPIVQDGKVILSKGYGLRDVKKNLPVTEKTLFAIGSATKSFTVTSLGVLVDQGKLDWDKPVRDYLPDFSCGISSRRSA